MQRRYEVSNNIVIKQNIYFPKLKKDVQAKIHVWCLILYCGLPSVVCLGDIFPNVLVHGKLCIHVFVNGVMKEFFTRYFNIWKKMLTARTLV